MDPVKEREFIERLKELSTADKAALRRNNGKLLSQADANAFALFYRIIPEGISYYNEDIWFVCACIESLWKDAAGTGISLAAAGRLVSNSEENENGGGFEKRFTTLMDMDWDEDGFMLRKLLSAVRFLKQKDFYLDMAQMIYDLCHWNHEDRYIQKKWAREYNKNTNEGDITDVS
ncbi:MAG: type I-E CRISPR-associated protein Cse2/CasB [Eubacteriaceae bacterium]|nr:type I-E CRISPR-associated protein Cse2/CasB [Eubacteriaceae bacterium]